MGSLYRRGRIYWIKYQCAGLKGPAPVTKLVFDSGCGQACRCGRLAACIDSPGGELDDITEVNLRIDDPLAAVTRVMKHHSKSLYETREAGDELPCSPASVGAPRHRNRPARCEASRNGIFLRRSAAGIWAGTWTAVSPLATCRCSPLRRTGQAASRIARARGTPGMSPGNHMTGHCDRRHSGGEDRVLPA